MAQDVVEPNAAAGQEVAQNAVEVDTRHEVAGAEEQVNADAVAVAEPGRRKQNLIRVQGLRYLHLGVLHLGHLGNLPLHLGNHLGNLPLHLGNLLHLGSICLHLGSLHLRVLFLEVRALEL